MKKEWFVLQTLTGKENKVKDSIKARVPMEGIEEFVGACEIPTEKVSETKDGKKRILTKKVFPGYVLVQLALYQDGAGIDKRLEGFRYRKGAHPVATGERASLSMDLSGRERYLPRIRGIAQ